MTRQRITRTLAGVTAVAALALGGVACDDDDDGNIDDPTDDIEQELDEGVDELDEETDPDTTDG
jgi:hypothetical protein